MEYWFYVLGSAIVIVVLLGAAIAVAVYLVMGGLALIGLLLDRRTQKEVKGKFKKYV